MTRRIVIDTDPGQDDAVAILLALASPELEVLGITAVAGNVPLGPTTNNVLKMVELAGRPDIPVYAGAEQPLVRQLVTAEYVHGKTGIDGAELPEPSIAPQPEHAVEFLIDTLEREPPQTVTLCTLGPLTNVGTLLQQRPDLAERVAAVVAMAGGFFEGGNTTPAAEFNIYVDPHAADIVFRAGIPMTLFPLDVTHKVLTSAARTERIRAIGTPVAEAVAGMIEFFERWDEEKYGTDGGPLHDPCVIAYLLEPELFGGRMCNVQVETESELTMGMTVIDWWKMTGLAENCMVMRDVDADRFFGLLTDRLARL